MSTRLSRLMCKKDPLPGQRPGFALSGKHSHQCHNPLHCLVPPYVIEHMAQSSDPEIRKIAMETMAASASMRTMRTTLAMMPMMSAMPSPAATKHRLIYDMKNQDWPLPGTLIRSEGDAATTDEAANEAYDYSGYTYDFYLAEFNRNSLDGNGMQLVSSVHRSRNYNNAFWNGEQMVYGDGDGRCFVRFTKALDVVGHELTHGVVMHTCNLYYWGEPGALNEHFADVFGALVLQWHLKQDVKHANWTIGAEIMGPGTKAKGIRTFKAGKAFEKDPCFGTDPQPKNMKDIYTGPSDNGGVHINSGIPNHAFYVAAMELGGNAWEKPGKIWYKTMLALNNHSVFTDMADMTLQSATSLFGAGSAEVKAVQKAWNAVGL